jgi:phosphoribosylpyrophosphate synthetase
MASLTERFLQPPEINLENKRISTAYHPYFSRFYHDMYSHLMGMISFNEKIPHLGGKRLPIGYEATHTDGSDFYAALEGETNWKSDCVIAPCWFAPPLALSDWAIRDMADTFTQSKKTEYDEEVLTHRFQIVMPYAELRQDQNSSSYLRTYWAGPLQAREAITADMFTGAIAAAGTTEAILLEPHSEIAMRHFTKHKINTLCLTAAPLFADWIVHNNLVNEKSIVVALDIGAAQKCMHLAEILGKRTGKKIEVVVLGKKRSGHSEVGQQDLLIGSFVEKDNAIIFDDLVASGGSILKTAKSLTEQGIKSVTPIITHGVLCGKYVENITEAQKMGIIKKFAVSNSLPQANDAEFLAIGLEVLEVEEMLAFFSRQTAITSIDTVKNDPRFKDYVMTPKPKMQVGLELNLPFEKILQILDINPESSVVIEEALRLPPEIRKKLPEEIQTKLKNIFEEPKKSYHPQN